MPTINVFFYFLSSCELLGYFFWFVSKSRRIEVFHSILSVSGVLARSGTLTFRQKIPENTSGPLKLGT